MKRLFMGFLVFALVFSVAGLAYSAWNPLPVVNDPLVRMPGTQPGQVSLEAPGRCLNCHSGYDTAAEPGFNWMGSMMAQASRDPMYYGCITVAGQDSIWAVGRPNAVDICERCHFPKGWLEGRSDPPNSSAMGGADFDGLSCDFCHKMWDPFFEDTYTMQREGDLNNDGTITATEFYTYFDEATGLSQSEADLTYAADSTLATAISLFSGGNFFVNKRPKYSTYYENASGQYYISSTRDKRASFADAKAKHGMFYSRYHKSKYFCATCHDVSNPALTNLGLSGLPDQSGGTDLITEQYPATEYFHVERTFAEFMSSDYGQPGGAATNSEFQAQGAPNITWANKCQDCHMRDVTGAGCNKAGVPVRPNGSTEHPNSGLPLHDLTGGNAWISYILASTDPNGPVYDPVNDTLLNQGASVLTLDLSQGESPSNNGAAVKAGSDRAKEQLLLAATIKNFSYNPSNGNISFQVQNNTGHKLISGFPEGRRMFVNITATYPDGSTYTVNPYDTATGTLKGLHRNGAAVTYSQCDPDVTIGNPADCAAAGGTWLTGLTLPLGANESYSDELVYEVHPSSSLTGEDETFHFVLADGRYKDNRIPPMGFDLTEAAKRISVPVWHGVSEPAYFSSAEYAGGYDDVSVAVPAGANYVEVNLYYQGTSREYIEFLRDEINGNASSLAFPTLFESAFCDNGTDTLPGSAGNPCDETLPAYIVQTDPFFAQLAAWGDTLWHLWTHNHGLDGSGAQVEGITPFLMAQAVYGAPMVCGAPTPTLLLAEPASNQVTITWSDEHTGDPNVTGYSIYYDQAGKSQYITTVGQTTTYADTGLTNGNEYCYKVTAHYADCEGDFSNILCATPTAPGQTQYAGVNAMETGYYGRGNTWVSTTAFNLGDKVVVRAYVIDTTTGLPLANATVGIQITGPETVNLTTGPTDAAGMAEATWQTSKPKGKQPGTTPGTYTATTTSVSLAGYSWDGVMTSTSFTLN